MVYAMQMEKNDSGLLGCFDSSFRKYHECGGSSNDK